MSATMGRTIHKPLVLMTLIIMELAYNDASAADALIIQPGSGDKLTTEVDVVVTHDDSTGLYKYSYTITNASDSLQSAWQFMLLVRADSTVTNIQSPPGWDSSSRPFYPYVHWAATGFDEDIPYDGVELPSPYQIKPGETLSGFSFENVVGPAEGALYVQGWTPAATEEMVEAGYDLDDQSPFVASKSLGMSALMPAEEGFVGLINITDRDTVPAPVSIVGRLSLAGEVVFPKTLWAQLNGENVTHLISTSAGSGGDFVVELNAANSNLAPGGNVLKVMVDGILPDSGFRWADIDTITFFVE